MHFVFCAQAPGQGSRHFSPRHAFSLEQFKLALHFKLSSKFFYYLILKNWMHFYMLPSFLSALIDTTLNTNIKMHDKTKNLSIILTLSKPEAEAITRRTWVKLNLNIESDNLYVGSFSEFL